VTVFVLIVSHAGHLFLINGGKRGRFVTVLGVLHDLKVVIRDF